MVETGIFRTRTESGRTVRLRSRQECHWCRSAQTCRRVRATCVWHTEETEEGTVHDRCAPSDVLNMEASVASADASSSARIDDPTQRATNTVKWVMYHGSNGQRKGSTRHDTASVMVS